MCGIVGCIGKENAQELVLEGLKRLEYRGYDSCGIALINEENNIYKTTKRVEELQKAVDNTANTVIGHTRWATHGGVTKTNAHPHVSFDNQMTLVHNGVIENYIELKEKYLNDIELKSQTDTEIILNVLNCFYNITKDMKVAMERFTTEVHGSYACIVTLATEKDKFYVLKNKTPLLLAKADGFYTISSDASAVYDQVESFYRFEDQEYAIIDQKNDKVTLYANHQEKAFEYETLDISAFTLDKEGYEDFMLKEINQQPSIIKNILKQTENLEINTDLKDVFMKTKKVFIVASGTSSYAGLVARRIIMRDLKVDCEVVIGSEFGYDDPYIDPTSVFIFISQSGETADSMVVFNKVVGKYPTISFTNTKESQLDARADYSYLLHAGMEVAVASTKAYTAQVAMLTIFIKQLINQTEEIKTELNNIIKMQTKVLNQETKIKELSKEIIKYEEIILLGRLVDYDVMQETALKIKEITYLNVNTYPGGELKHGPIALIDETRPTIALLTQEHVSDHMKNNIQEIKARGGKVYTVATKQIDPNADFMIDFDASEELAPLVSVIVFQILSYHMAKLLDRDIDKPRNLAKSVTVE